ncbi:hypothetical protein KEJ17_08175 [Candidatus Bathyarchaeota archaeon]|nr:hypothetical protein [Candidatus Bathyarchaeota archaeon]
MNREIKILSFDYGGTLCHDLEESHVALQRILNNLGFNFEISKVSEAWQDAHLWWSNVKRETGAVMNAENLIRLFQRTALNLGIPNSESMLAAKRLFERWPCEVKIKAYEDVIPTLSELKSVKRTIHRGLLGKI